MVLVLVNIPIFYFNTSKIFVRLLVSKNFFFTIFGSLLISQLMSRI